MPQAKSPERLNSRAPFSLKAIAIYTVSWHYATKIGIFPSKKNDCKAKGHNMATELEKISKNTEETRKASERQQQSLERMGGDITNAIDTQTFEPILF